ncbi:MAG TPA: chromosome segregation protein SMC [Ignavibacteria bacterium]|nr:chromosome segregation protein SMC [Ignavibacteria bacterium]HMQ99007.1 chromosome segregation protein SMC [Ignavibacteria bacterium]
MYLSKLEIFGFKSFADKIAVDFDAGMTAIVGPNGCGKTNIVDAVRWAIGEQKASVLRSSTMENVIFNGTKNRKPLGYAEVSLTVQNTKGILPSEYTEIKITRRCFRDGASNYMLNGVNCRLKDITALFMDTGMGSDAYSVIELKMVNEILSHRTQDRRKLFEEASGITKYKERRREALYKLEVARENINEANIEIRNRQRTVNAYERIAQKQQEAKEVSVKLKEIEIEYHTRALSKLLDETKSIEGELKIKETEREKLQHSLNENESIIDKYKSELTFTESRLNDSREKLNNINLNINELQTAISIAEQRIKYLDENIERFKREKIEIEAEIERLSIRKTEIEDKIVVLKNTTELMEGSRITKKTSLDETEQKVKVSKEELKDLTSKHASSSKALQEKRSEYEIIKNRLEDQISRCSKLAEDNIVNINKVAGYDQSLRDAETSLKSLKEELTLMTSEFSEQKKLKENLREELSRLEKDIIYRQHEADKLKNKIEFQTNLLENFDDYSEGIKHLVKEKNEKAGFVVIDKLEVEDKFKIAIETALGEISNYLIVENLDAAENFIKILTRDQKGKVTFIIKDKLYNTTMNIFQEEFPEILGHEGVYGWADRFVKCPDEYFMLYKYLLDEFVIVENIDIARKLSSDNFIKFITLDGDIITNSFLRAGSKTNIESLKIGREKLIADLQKQINEIEESISSDSRNLSELKSSYAAIDVDIRQNRIQEKRAQVLNAENKLQQLQFSKNETNKLIAHYKQENDELNISNKELSDKMDSLIQDIESAENVKYQREKELEHFTTELENLADELTSQREEYNTFNIEITKVKAEFKNLENEHFRTDESIKSRKSSIEARALECNEYESEIKKLSAEIEAYNSENSVNGLKPRLKLLEIEKAGIESDFALIRSEYEVKRSLVDKVESEQKELRNNRDSIIDFIHKNEMKLTRDRLEIKEHRDRVKEEYELDIEYTVFEDSEIFDLVKAKAEVDRLKNKLRTLGGSGQLELNLYEQEKQELEKLSEERNDLVKAEQDLINLIDEINKTAQNKFTETFEQIRQNFIAIFKELFLEGDESDLRLVIDPDNPDPLDAKIDIIAKPRGKRPQLIDLLSGGEKTLTAIALLFAIYQVKPSPFCILDEVDAPLDDANIDRYIKIIRKFAQDTQFIIVTHNKRTMEAADSMYGVTMAEQGISTIVNVKFNDQKIAS